MENIYSLPFPTLTRGADPKIFTDKINEMIRNEEGQYAADGRRATYMSPEIFTVQNIDQRYYAGRIYPGTGFIDEKGESEDFKIGGYKTIDPWYFEATTYAKEYRVSKELVDDDKIGEVTELIREFHQSAIKTRDMLAFKHLASYFSDHSKPHICSDGKAVIATDHQTLDGQTVSNKITGAYSKANLQAALLALVTMPNLDGTPAGFSTKFTLVTSYTDFQTAMVDLGSEYTTGSNNNDIQFVSNAFPITLKYSTWFEDAFQGLIGSNLSRPWIVFADNAKVRRMVRQDTQTFIRDYTQTGNYDYGYNISFVEGYVTPTYAGIAGGHN